MSHVRMSSLCQKRYRDVRETCSTWPCLPVIVRRPRRAERDLADENVRHLEREGDGEREGGGR